MFNIFNSMYKISGNNTIVNNVRVEAVHDENVRTAEDVENPNTTKNLNNESSKNEPAKMYKINIHN